MQLNPIHTLLNLLPGNNNSSNNSGQANNNAPGSIQPSLSHLNQIVEDQFKQKPVQNQGFGQYTKNLSSFGGTTDGLLLFLLQLLLNNNNITGGNTGTGILPGSGSGGTGGTTPIVINPGLSNTIVAGAAGVTTGDNPTIETGDIFQLGMDDIHSKLESAIASATDKTALASSIETYITNNTDKLTSDTDLSDDGALVNGLAKHIFDYLTAQGVTGITQQDVADALNVGYTGSTTPTVEANASDILERGIFEQFDEFLLEEADKYFSPNTLIASRLTYISQYQSVLESNVDTALDVPLLSGAQATAAGVDNKTLRDFEGNLLYAGAFIAKYSSVPFSPFVGVPESVIDKVLGKSPTIPEGQTAESYYGIAEAEKQAITLEGYNKVAPSLVQGIGFSPTTPAGATQPPTASDILLDLIDRTPGDGNRDTNPNLAQYTNIGITRLLEDIGGLNLLARPGYDPNTAANVTSAIADLDSKGFKSPKDYWLIDLAEHISNDLSLTFTDVLNEIGTVASQIDPKIDIQGLKTYAQALVANGVNTNPAVEDILLGLYSQGLDLNPNQNYDLTDKYSDIIGSILDQAMPTATLADADDFKAALLDSLSTAQSLYQGQLSPLILPPLTGNIFEMIALEEAVTGSQSVPNLSAGVIDTDLIEGLYDLGHVNETAALDRLSTGIFNYLQNTGKVAGVTKNDLISIFEQIIASPIGLDLTTAWSQAVGEEIREAEEALNPPIA